MHTSRPRPQLAGAECDRLIYDCLKDAGVRIVSALPETWLVHLIRMAEDDAEMQLVRRSCGSIPTA